MEFLHQKGHEKKLEEQDSIEYFYDLMPEISKEGYPALNIALKDLNCLLVGRLRIE